MSVDIRHLTTPEDLVAVEELQQQVWPGNDIEIVAVHMLQAVLYGGGVLIGAFDSSFLVGFVFGFVGFNTGPDELGLWHISHMAGVHPDYRDVGLGFKLKRAQWQTVRQQGLERITWTYDPLQSRNAMLNIAKLGGVSSTYYPNYYGELRDELNVGLPTDRLRVDLWVNSHRVKRRLSATPSKKLDLAHYLSAGTACLNETRISNSGLIAPCHTVLLELSAPLFLFEIPTDFSAIKNADPPLALEWRQHAQNLFEKVFAAGYLITDFVFLPGRQPRSYYVLSFGESTF